MKKFTRTAVAIAAIGGLLAGAAIAQSAVDGAVKARKAQMQLQVFYAGPLFAMASEKAPYDAERAKLLAENLDHLVNLDFGLYFPDGSSNADVEGTRALPAIWESPDKVTSELAAIRTAADNLAGVAGNGLDALKGAIGPVGQVCTSCHEAFRAPQ